MAVLGLLAVLATGRGGVLVAPGPAVPPPPALSHADGCSSFALARTHHCSSIARVLQLRGGRVQERVTRFDAKNEELALAYLAAVCRKGQSTSLDQNQPDDGDGEAPAVGVAEQVKDEEAESKRRSMVYTRSVHWKTTKRTALGIQLADEHWKKVNAVRVQHDKTFDHWFTPTIKLTLEFFTAERLWEAAEMVQQCVSQMAPFAITLTKLRVVQHSMDACLWLEPSAVSRQLILELRAALIARFPTLDGKEQLGEDGLQPHVRLGSFKDTAAAERFREAMLAEGGWTNMSFQASAVTVYARSGLVSTEPFDPYRVCVIGGAGRGGQELDASIFNEAERNLEDGDFEGEWGGVFDTNRPVGVVQQWIDKSGRFEIVKGEEDLHEVNARKEKLQAQVRANKLEKSDRMARDFLHLPSRHQEEIRAKIPHLVVEQVRQQSSTAASCPRPSIK
jgi:hypothetical protein